MKMQKLGGCCAALSFLFLLSPTARADRTEMVAVPVEEPGEESSPFPPGTRSVKVRQKAVVFAEPSRRAEKLGVIAKRAHVAWRSVGPSKGCKWGWLEVEPRGWICARTQPSEEAPDEFIRPQVPAGSLVPGKYARVAMSKQDVVVYSDQAAVAAGQGGKPTSELDVRLTKAVNINGETYWRTQTGQYVASKHVRRFGTSKFAGVDLTDSEIQVPFLWARAPSRSRQIEVRSTPERRGEIVRKVDPRTRFPLLEESDDGKFVRVGMGEWIARRHARIARRSPAPEELPGKNAVWVDLDIAEQVLIVYRGETPIYATLVSSGKKERPTPLGVYRLQNKIATTTMNSTETSEDQYSVADVPWVMYFRQYYALHGAYWHDGFGRRRSHGCVNLSPRDARAVYQLLDPALPPGWQEINASEENPGSVVRIRDSVRDRRRAERERRRAERERRRAERRQAAAGE